MRVTKSGEKSGEVALPAGAAVLAASKGTVSLGSAVDPKLGFAKNDFAEWVAQNRIEGEQIFAAQYRVVNLRRGFFNRYITIANDVRVVDLGHGVFGDAKTEKPHKKIIRGDENEDEDDDSDSGSDTGEDSGGLFEPIISDESLEGGSETDVGSAVPALASDEPLVEGDGEYSHLELTFVS